MKRIGLYLKNRKFNNIDCSDITHGNPGIGGTHYAILLLADALTKNKKYNIVVLSETTENLPSNLNVIQTNDCNISEVLITQQIDILIAVKIDKSTITKDFLKKIPISTSIIIWCHCFVSYKDLNIFAKAPNIKRVIFVGKEHLLKYCDHPIYKKSSYIYNIYNQLSNYQKRANRKRENIVTYIGSIVPLKGLHLLTSCWPKVIEQIPDAKLYIIGSGKLYNQQSKLGKFGIAEYFYEKKILNPILTKEGNIISSVVFYGILGQEKNRILEMTKVGIPNPSGKTETFGYTALEFQDAGATIVTKKCVGYVETVFNWESNLYENEKCLANYIIKALKSDYQRISPEQNAEWDKFSSFKIAQEWITIFDSIIQSKEIPLVSLDTSINSTKRIITNKKLQEKIRWIPSTILIKTLLAPINYLISKILFFPDTLAKIWKRVILRFINNKFNNITKI